MKQNKVVLAGAGPGDKDLITIKLLKTLKEAEVILYDRLVNKDILKLANEKAELVYVGKKNTERGKIQNTINELLVQYSKENKKVLRLKGGDPFLFGRGSEEAKYLIDNGIDIEIIPGITSPIAVPEYAGIPVTSRGISAEVHIFTGHKSEKENDLNFGLIAKLEGTLIFLMSVENIKNIVKQLLENGKDKDTLIAFIENGTTHLQRTTVMKLKEIENEFDKKEIKAPAIIVIGDVVEFSNYLSWFNKKDYSSQKILNTRYLSDGNDELTSKLEELGFDVINEPFIKIEKSKIDIAKINNSDILLFNSINSVNSFFDSIEDIRIISNKIIGAVGLKTAQELKKYYINADIIPKEFTSYNLISEIEKKYKNKKVVIIGSDKTNVDLEDTNKRCNNNYELIVAYFTKKIKHDADLLKDNDFNYICFTSPTAVESFFENYNNEDLSRYKYISIGPVTSKKIKEYGQNPYIEPKVHTIDGIILELEKKKD